MHYVDALMAPEFLDMGFLVGAIVLALRLEWLDSL
jgi:hypothetical protein